MSPMVQDVYLPIHAIVSADALLSFVKTLSMLDKLPNHGLVKDSIMLVVTRESASDSLSFVELDVPDKQFGSGIDMAWMAQKRSEILVEAELAGQRETEEPDEVVFETCRAAVTAAKKKKKKEGKKGGPKSVQPDDKGKGRETYEGDESNVRAAKDEEELVDDDEFEISARSFQEVEEEIVEGMNRAEKEYYKAKFQEGMTEPSAPQDGAPSQKHQHEPDLHSDLHGRRQACSPLLREHYSQRAKKGEEEAALGKGASSGSLSEPQTQSEIALSPATGSANHKEDSEEHNEKAKLQRELQSKISNSLSSRGKPTSSKSPAYKRPSIPDLSSKDAEPQTKPMSGAIETYKPSADRLSRAKGSTPISNDSQSVLAPFTHDDWIKSRSKDTVPGEGDGNRGGEAEGGETEEEL